MSGFGETLRNFLFGSQPETPRRSGPANQRGRSHPPKSRKPTRRPASKVQVVQCRATRPPRPYWQLRGWQKVSNGLYLGYFKTPLGRCHGVIKWVSQFNFGIYVHDVPAKILRGPHSACFTAVKPKKFRVHFAQQPRDLNSVIFYVETLLQEGFKR